MQQPEDDGEPAGRAGRRDPRAMRCDLGSSSRDAASVSARSRRAMSRAVRRSASVYPALNCRRAWLRWNPTTGRSGAVVIAARSNGSANRLPESLGGEVADRQGRRTVPTTRDRAPAEDSGCRARRAAKAAVPASSRAPERVRRRAPRHRRSVRQGRVRDTGRSPSLNAGGSPGAACVTLGGGSLAWRTQQGGQVGRLEGEAAAHREVADDAERVDVAASVDGSPAACSGLMNCTVPMILPGSVTGPASCRRGRCRSR